MGDQFVLAAPEVGQVGDVQQQAFRLVAFFERDARAEAFAGLGQLGECVAVDDGLVRCDGQVAHERLGFGERLAEGYALSGGVAQQAATIPPRGPFATSASGRFLSSGRERSSRWIGQFGNHRQRMRVMGWNNFSHRVRSVVDFEGYVAAGAAAPGAGEVDVEAAVEGESWQISDFGFRIADWRE